MLASNVSTVVLCCRYRDSVVEVWVLGGGGIAGGDTMLLRAAVGRLPRDRAVLLAHHMVDFNQDFLNRVDTTYIANLYMTSRVAFWEPCYRPHGTQRKISLLHL